MDDFRAKVLRLVESRTPPTTLKEASIAVGKNHAYLHQFVHKGTPRHLSETVRIKLARFLHIEEKELLAPDQLHLVAESRQTLPDGEYDFIPVYDVKASAGSGCIAEQSGILHYLPFRAEWLKRCISTPASALAAINVTGDSMEPTLSEDDTVLIDTKDATVRDSGLYVLRYDGYLFVKRVQIDPARRLLSIISDNPAYSAIENVSPDEVHVFGRVVWLSRLV